MNQLDEAEKIGLPPLPATEVFRGAHDKKMEKMMRDLIKVMKENKDELLETAGESCNPHVYLIKPISLMEDIVEHQRLKMSLLKKLNA